MIVTSEYIFLNPKLSGINDIIEKTRVEHDQKYGDSYCGEIGIKYNNNFLDTIKNKTKKFYN